MDFKRFYDIVIIDSGLNTSDNLCMGDLLNGFGYYRDGEHYYVDTDFNDFIGHGTAVYNIIKSYTSDAQICIIKIFKEKMIVAEDTLVSVLNFIYENISCKIINLSLGINECINRVALYDICKKLYLKNILLVAAFDNNGSMSSPAAFDCVIGVDSDYRCKSLFDFDYVEGSPINIKAKGGLQRVRWNGGKYIVLGGSSFSCAYITAFLNNEIKTIGHQINYEEALLLLKKRAASIYYSKHPTERKKSIPFKIQKAAIFPFNKEMHQIVRFSHMLSFEVSNVYDIRYSGRVGTRTSRLLPKSGFDAERDYVIEDIDAINCESFDTLILGHMDEINRIVGYDLQHDIIEKMKKNKINIYSFDYCIGNRGDSSIYCPYVFQADVPDNTFGKLYGISKPVVGVFGTSSAQGKFTLQIILRNLFTQLHYKVGSVGTEPHSVLFGMDYVYPMGYSSSVDLNGWDAVTVLNRMVHDLCDKDIIIVGSQANTIPINRDNLSSFPMRQHSFLLGTDPDAVILCVNPHDEEEYIINTIKYIEGVANSKVIALVLFPMKIINDWRSTFGKKVNIDEQEYDLIKNTLEITVDKPVFQLGDKTHMNSLAQYIIEFFS